MFAETERSRSPLFITRIAAFTAIGVVVGLVLAAVPNVEGVTAICFAAGYLLGPVAGILCGALTEALFAGFHPMGSSIGITLLLQVLGMSITGLLGGLAGKLGSTAVKNAVIVVACGVLSTIQFDFLTNLAYIIMAGFSFSQALVVYTAALPFALIHSISNLLIFAIIVVPLLPRLERTLAQT